MTYVYCIKCKRLFETLSSSYELPILIKCETIFVHITKHLSRFIWLIQWPHMGIQYKLKICKLIYYLFQQEWLFKSINIFDQQIWISFPYRYVAKYFSFAIETLLYSEHFYINLRKADCTKNVHCIFQTYTFKFAHKISLQVFRVILLFKLWNLQIVQWIL